MDVYKEWLGIPDGPRPPDHYELLRCVRFEDDAGKVRAHYKKLNAHVRKYATGQYSVQSQDLLNEMAKAMLCLTDAESKRDYDESLGREFAPQRDEFGRLPLLDVLVKQGQISREQKQEVEDYSSRTGVSERDAVVQLKLVAPEAAAQALALQLGHAFVDLEDMLPEDAALDMVPRGLVKKHSFLPLFVDDDRLMVACISELEHHLEEELQLRYGVPVRPVIVTPRALQQAIARYYAPGMRDETAAQAAVAQASQSKRKGGAGGGGSGGKPSAREPRRAWAQLTPEEQQQKKYVGYIVICWTVIFFMLPQILASIGLLRQPLFGLGMFACVAMAIVGGGLAFLWVTQRYWK